MLKHTDTESISTPAAQVRVTPEEMAAAITQIEARKDAGQRKAEGTVPIGEVVQQLGLDTTPEEVLAQVQADRAQQRKRVSLKQRVAGILAVGVVLIGLAALQTGPLFIDPPMDNVTPVPNTSFVVAPSRKPQHIHLDSNLLVGDASGKLVMLSEVADKQPVRCSYDNLSDSFQPYIPNNPVMGATWTLIKHGGRVYVRGWILRMSDKVMQTEGVDVTAHNDGNFVVPVTLPLANFNILSNVGSIAEFHAQDIHLDNHAWEKW